MKIIQSTYRGYYKTEQEVRDAMKVMSVVLKDWEYPHIERAVINFIKTDTKGFPPVPGQLIALAQDIKTDELRKRQIEQSKLPEPEKEYIPMPEEIKQKLREMFNL
jgi:hypothetical protein